MLVQAKVTSALCTQVRCVGISDKIDILSLQVGEIDNVSNNMIVIH
jgi:hypothetical protein